MERYRLVKQVGHGAFGNVWRAINKQSGELIAIKKMKRKYYSWEECVKLREVKSLKRMKHPNIVKLKEVIRENDILYIVFEYMECNLYQLITDRGEPFSEAEIRNWCFQIFQALAYMHGRGYFHRDLKPENLLVTKDIIKLADFGLAREIDSQEPYTEYVSTRWYRAPEILLQSPIYDSAVDIWAMGAIMAELFTLHPLFPGSSEADEVHTICKVLGSPTQSSWAEGIEVANAIGCKFPQYEPADISTLIPSASADAINLILSLCAWDPQKRPLAGEVLQHSFFQPCSYIPQSLSYGGARGTASAPSSRASEPKLVRTLSNGTTCVVKHQRNFSSVKPAMATSRTAVQRKLALDRNTKDHVLHAGSLQNTKASPNTRSAAATGKNPAVQESRNRGAPNPNGALQTSRPVSRHGVKKSAVAANAASAKPGLSKIAACGALAHATAGGANAVPGRRRASLQPPVLVVQPRRAPSLPPPRQHEAKHRRQNTLPALSCA